MLLKSEETREPQWLEKHYLAGKHKYSGGFVADTSSSQNL